MNEQYDYIIIGSGFGGSVSALRLAQKGYKVLVLEKGKWYKETDFPKTNWNLPKWLWMPKLRFFGIMKLNLLPHIAVLSGTGVGGGSLVYANTLPVPKTAFYKTGSWSDLENWQEALKPFYQKAKVTLGVERNPKLFDADKVLQEMAQDAGLESKFNPTDVGVFFGKPGKTVKDPYFNGEGPDRAGCIFCGACMTGCRHNAKNTLDKNYLYLAQKLGVEILAEQEVIDVVSKADGDYEVQTKRSTQFFASTKSFRSKGVVFSGGVMGTVRLLLKLKKKSLPKLSNKLGHDVRTNNETLLSISADKKGIDMSKGLAIGSILHTDENTHLEICRYGEGSGFWKTIHLPMSKGKSLAARSVGLVLQTMRYPGQYFKAYFRQSWSKNTVVLLFMQTLDSTIRLQRGYFGFLLTKPGEGKLPSADIPESHQLTKEYGRKVNGQPSAFAVETILGIPSTAHILGGAVMGKTEAEGVVDKFGRVFNYSNMYIADGSVISANPGVNPSLSITAISEWIMDHIPEKKQLSKEQNAATIVSKDKIPLS